MRSLLSLPIALVAVACGIPRDQFNAKALEAAGLARQYKDEAGRAAAAEQKIRELEARLAAESAATADRLHTAQGWLVIKEAERRALAERNLQLVALNDELSKSRKKLAEAKEQLGKKSSEYDNLAQSLKVEIEAGKIELSELKGRMTVKLKDKVLFSSGSVRIGNEGLGALVKVAQALKAVTGKRVRVEGHTDDDPTDPRGPFPSNWELSQARAVEVVKQLQEAGVDPTRLSAAGYGQYQPIAPNDTAENKSLNRRIEIVLAPEIDSGPGEARSATR